ncbi:hypothetical protein FKW77_008510 [Venturia effusa]|uniref:Uncharacterized protein n=1 Tax=Venturia effusa TaxID=50376 RepID=A0A517LHR1_9PEZI|nr:hypothetical protein FKW77_008510 [Venturia effusa]
MSKNNGGVLNGLEQGLMLKLLLAAVVVYTISYMVYNVFFHPLSKFPGPRMAAATPIYYAYYIMTGRQVKYNKVLHEKYGEVVRVKPNELSFISENTWRDVYMHRQGQPQMEKARRDHFSPHPGVFNLVNAPDDVHSRQRRAVSHAFSDRALKEQEPLIQKYVNLLMIYLREQAQKDEAFDVVSPLNYTTFDVIADLAFGESFHALETRRNHPWIEAFFEMIIPGCVMFELMEFPGCSTLFNIFIRPLIVRRIKTGDYAQDKIAERLERGAGNRPDLMSFVLKNNELGKGLSRREIIGTFNIFMIAGSETTATLLSGAIYLLLRTPRVMELLKKEIRDAFNEDGEIDLIKTGQLPYLAAVMEESLRMYPPAPQGINRISPPSGATIAGHHIPGNVVVGVHLGTAFRSPTNFADASEFIPERWIETQSPRFKHDKRDVLKPFSAGPRNCIGQNLAYFEMKLIMARLIFNFDLELVDPEDDWFDQKTYILWKKKPLMVKVREVVRG